MLEPNFPLEKFLTLLGGHSELYLAKAKSCMVSVTPDRDASGGLAQNQSGNGNGAWIMQCCQHGTKDRLLKPLLSREVKV